MSTTVRYHTRSLRPIDNQVYYDLVIGNRIIQNQVHVYAILIHLAFDFRHKYKLYDKTNNP
jgi:hypothetical protein